MRTITQPAEVLDLALTSIIVDDTDTPMQVVGPYMLCVLAGPEAGSFRSLADPEAVALSATVRWEPVS